MLPQDSILANGVLGENMQALRIFSNPYRQKLLDHQQPAPRHGQVLIKINYSSLNYKDALAITGRGKIIRKFPLTAGIDLAGSVSDAGSSQFAVGDQVLATGGGLGEAIDGGYAEFCSVPAEALISLPTGLTLREAMIIGTAGFTAGLCLERMETNGQRPQQGAIAITGASGGVGSLAISIFRRRGYRVTAFSNKNQLVPWLKQLGADEVYSPSELKSSESAHLASARYGGAIDNLGGDYLATLLKTTVGWGNVASVGLADSAILKTSVFPHILRGVNLLGISSSNCPIELRRKIWQRLASDLKPQLSLVDNGTITLAELTNRAEQMIAGKTHGRIVVKI